MANANQQQSQPQPQTSAQPPSSGKPSTPRHVQFVIDRDTIVEAEIINTHPDGRVDLRGRFGQSNKRWEDKETIHEVTGEKEIFAQEVSTPDPRVTERTRVRPADLEDVRVGRYTPGTFFFKGEVE